MKSLLTVLLLGESSRVELELEQGKIVGELDDENGVEVYEGIPYALPPVDELRWQPTKALNSFSELNRDQIQYAFACTQGNNWEPESEDCLQLRIYKPIKNETQPIMIYFHGGGHQVGNGMWSGYGGTWLAKDWGNIVVTVNYRLGIFGNMNYFDIDLDTTAGGNYGLLDQQMAIKFIHQNAQRLGADPNRITIFGESAGGESVSNQILSHESVNYVSRAIVQSGAVWWNTNLLSKYPVINEVIEELCDSMKQNKCACQKQGDIRDTIDRLRNCKANAVQNKYNQMMNQNPLRYQPWYPIARDGVFFRTDAKEDMQRGGMPFHGPIIMGTCSYEGSLMGGWGEDSNYHPQDIRNVLLISEATMFEPVPEWQWDFIVEEYFNFYREELFPTLNSYWELSNADAFTLASLIGGDVGFRVNSFQQADLYVNNGNDIYIYLMDGFRHDDYVRYPGAWHTREEPYVWGYTRTYEYPNWNNGRQPLDWEHDVTAFFESQWSRMSHRGAPRDEWSQYDKKREALTIGRGTFTIENQSDTMMDFWLNVWSPDWKKDEANLNSQHTVNTAIFPRFDGSEFKVYNTSA